jgi:hypothetical protein
MVAIDIDFDFHAPSEIFLAKTQGAKDAKSSYGKDFDATKNEKTRPRIARIETDAFNSRPFMISSWTDGMGFHPR